MSTPNLPLTENLLPLYELNFQLESILEESNVIKDSIKNCIDTLTELNNDKISNIEEDRAEYLKQLKIKNEKLKKEVHEKQEFLKLIAGLLNNYEVSISTILEYCNEDVLNYCLKFVQINRDSFTELVDKLDLEFKEFEKLIQLKLKLFKVLDFLRDLVNKFDEEVVFKNGLISKILELEIYKKLLVDLTEKKILFSRDNIDPRSKEQIAGGKKK